MMDFRSDTVTRPTKEMLEAMMTAKVGDDVFGDDPTVNELQEFAANLFGKEAALYCSSGTQTNQIALNVHLQPGDEVIFHEDAHIYRYEGGGIARNSGASCRFIRGDFGRINAAEIRDCINPNDPHYPITKLVSIEDTANRGGGKFYDFEEIKRIKSVCDQTQLKLHLDGARVFNALEESKIATNEYGQQFDTISICLSKGLGAPVGSLLLGPAEFILKAKRVRKVFGGGMRQAGIIAAGGLFALKNNIHRLSEDHKRAKEIEQILLNKSWISEVIPVSTNIVVAHVRPDLTEQFVVQKLAEIGVFCVPFGKGRIRFVTHLDINDHHINQLSEILPQDL